MRASGAVNAAALAAVRTKVAVGVSLRELDEIAHAVITDAGGRPTFLGYRPHFAVSPYPAAICTSVNHAALHGIPDAYQLRDGDLLSVDCGTDLDGWASDAAFSVVAGTADPSDEQLIAVAWEAFDAGVAASVVGARIGDISHAIGAVARRAGYGVSTEFGGHGIGRAMHEDPSVPNDGRPGRGMRLRAGMVFAIEPWFMAGGRDECKVDDDGWTVRTTDGSRAAHVEHTVAITDNGPEVLTRASD